ncbi:unnamed protein product [Caenorhabditis auriculariae]|uniref:Peptidase M13 C-terminal domain-containing protein n=1 Tax=Caenorhabditis auriculariae TaxID=2777116 RepID=A0A8S1GRV6_9PELO|nr:unnamed protein product [Caenorhabditis auriculariae]
MLHPNGALEDELDEVPTERDQKPRINSTNSCGCIKLNDSVDPCDDFYDHVCPMGIRQEDSFSSLATAVFNKELDEVATEFDDFTKDLKSQLKSRSMVDQLLEICYKPGVGKLLALTVARAAFPTFPLAANSNCESIAFLFGYTTTQNELSETFFDVIHLLLDTPRILKSFRSSSFTESRAISFELYKNLTLELQQEIQNTPWVAYHNGTVALTEFLAKKMSYFTVDDSLLEKWEQYYRETAEIYRKDNCSLVCIFLEVFSKLIGELYMSTEVAFLGMVRSQNAFNNQNEVILTPATQLLALTPNKARMLGTIGVTFAHEIMHSFYVTYSSEYLAQFWTNSSGCVKEQYKATCEEFAGKSDIRGITTPQMFFYSLAAKYCSNAKNRYGYPKDTHSGNKVRINAMAAQMDEFKEAFQCADGSRMVRSKTEHCVIFGRDAPGTR